MKRLVSLVGILTLVSSIAGFALAVTNYLTKDKIALEEHNKFLEGLSAVVSTFDNSPDNDTVVIDNKTIYVFKVNDNITAYAMEWISTKGYSGNIKVLIGVDIEGKITGVEVLSHTETIGLGDKILNKDWLLKFIGRDDADKIFVKNDGGEIDAFSGATISPRAVAEAVRNALAFIQIGIVKGDL